MYRRVCVLVAAAIICMPGCKQQSASTDDIGDNESVTKTGELLENDVTPSRATGEVGGPNEAPLIPDSKKHSWRFRNILREHTERVRAVAFSPDSKLMASGSDDSKIHIWDTSNWELLRTVDTDTDVFGIEISRDGVLAMAGRASVHILDSQTGVQQRSLAFKIIYGFDFEPDQNIVAACTDAETKAWNAETGDVVASVRGHSDLISDVAISKQGLLASGSHDEKIKLWDIKTSNEKAVLDGQDGMISCLTFSPDGMTLASGAHNHTIVLWDVASAMESKRLECSATPMALEFSSDGKTLVEGRWDGNVYIWNVASGEKQAILQDAEYRINGVAISPDSSLIASAEAGGTITVWERD